MLLVSTRAKDTLNVLCMVNETQLLASASRGETTGKMGSCTARRTVRLLGEGVGNGLQKEEYDNRVTSDKRGGQCRGCSWKVQQTCEGPGASQPQ